MNGGVHQIGRRAGINSGMGVVAGVPDVVIVFRGAVYALEPEDRHRPPDEGAIRGH
jgi:hypothetical protein